MPSTGSRSRDEWLAEVQRRGWRIRRRRRLATVAVGALALVLPVSAVVTLLGGEGDRGVELTAAGPAPSSTPAVTGHVSGPPDPTTAVQGEPTTADGATEPSGSPSPTTTVEVHERVASINGSQLPRSGASVPPADDPVVRPTPAPPSTGDSTATGNAAGPVSPPTGPPTGDPEPAPCPAADVNVTVVTEKATYAPGETVRGSSTLENASATSCLLPTRAFFRIVDAAGRTVGSFAYTLELRRPVNAEPGQTFTSTFTWDQKDCSGSSCAQVPAGTYVAVADWNESGPYAGRGSFRITP